MGLLDCSPNGRKGLIQPKSDVEAVEGQIDDLGRPLAHPISQGLHHRAGQSADPESMQRAVHEWVSMAAVLNDLCREFQIEPPTMVLCQLFEGFAELFEAAATATYSQMAMAPNEWNRTETSLVRIRENGPK